MVPITNSLAFMFTVLGEWFATKKVISRGQSLVSIIMATMWYTNCIIRHLDWHGLGARRYRFVRPFEEHMNEPPVA